MGVAQKGGCPNKGTYKEAFVQMGSVQIRDVSDVMMNRQVDVSDKKSDVMDILLSFLSDKAFCQN